MKRISTATSVPNKFGAGKNGFTDGNVVGGIPSTDLEAQWFDSVQEEVANVVEDAGIVLDGNDRTQLLQALRRRGMSPVGTVRNLRASLAAASMSATFTADEVVVASALGGSRYLVSGVNKTINLATVGAGGMDTGAAPTGFVGVYLLLNPTTGATALLGVNGSGVALPEVYGGANMPVGYTASALISCLRTTAGAGFQVFAQTDRSISVATVLEQSTSTATGTPAAFTATSLSRNAKTVSGSVTFSCNAAAGGGTSVFGFSAGVGAQGINLTVSAGGTASVSFSNVPVISPPTLYYTGTTSAGTGTYQVSVSGYTI